MNTAIPSQTTAAQAILVVEDEQHIANGLRFNLEAEGYLVQLAADGETALELLLKGQQRFAAIVLDVMLPGKDGFEVAQELRAAGQFAPILMLTARNRPEDILRGFEAGADDYLPKPFELRILLARLNGLLRRRTWLQIDAVTVATPATEDTTNDSVPTLFQFADKTIDFGALELHAHGKVIQLTLMEAELLRFLIRHENQAVARRVLLENVWGMRDDTDTRAIDNFIVRLRKYVEIDPTQPRHLLTVRGVGYRFIAEPET